MILKIAWVGDFLCLLYNGISMKNEKKHNKELFIAEAVIGIAASIMLIVVVGLAALIAEKEPAVAGLIIGVSFLSFFVVCLGLTKMEQIVGYYQCTKCRHKHVPTYNEVLWSMHLGRTRRMPCPKCHKKTWQRKVLS